MKAQLIALLLATLTTAHAGRLIGTSGVTDSLYEIDPVTGTATLIGATGVNGASLALAADRDTCRVWSLEWLGSSAPGLYTVDTSTGSITAVGGNISYGQSGMAYDPNNEILFATDPDTETLYRVDPAKGMGTVIGLLPDSIAGLAYDPNHDILYGTSSTLNNLYSIDPATGASTTIGSLGFNTSLMGLAYNWEEDILYLNDVVTDSLYTVNTTTGAATLVGANGSDINIQSLTYEPDPAPRRLLGMSGSEDASYHLSPSTGEAILIGEIGFTPPTVNMFPAGLATDRVTGTVWAVIANDPNLYTMNPATGALTVVASGTAFISPGLAYDPVNEVLYASSGGSIDKLYSISTTTAVATEIGPTPNNISGLAFDPDNAILYGTSTTTDELYILDASTGAETLVGSLGFDPNNNGLAYDWDRDILYLTEVITDSLYTLNTTTGAATLVGPTVSPNIQSLCYHVPPRTSPQTMLVGIDRLSDNLVEIDPQTGVVTTIGPVGFTALGIGSGMAADRDSNTIWSLLDQDANLYRVDLVSGTHTAVGAGTALRLPGLAYDPVNEVLYAADWTTNALYTINTATGVATQIGLTGFPNIGGLAYDADNAVLYGVSGVTDSLYTLNTSTGVATLVGGFGVNAGTAGLAYDWGSGILYMNDTTTQSLYTIDTGTGAASLVGSLGSASYDSLAIVTPCALPRDLAITAATRSGSTMQIDFDGPFDRGFFDLKGSADLLSFPSDHTGISTFTEQGPGRYRFTTDVSTFPDDYFFRVEKP